MSSDTPSGCGSMKDQGIEGVNFALIWIWRMEEENMLIKSTEALQNNKINILRLSDLTVTPVPSVPSPLSVPEDIHTRTSLLLCPVFFTDHAVCKIYYWSCHCVVLWAFVVS